MSITTRAQATVKMEIVVTGVWGEECTVVQVMEQAVEEASNTLRVALSSGDHSGDQVAVSEATRQSARGRCRVVGSPTMTIVLSNAGSGR